MRAWRAACCGNRGITLIEIVIALTILSIVLVSLGGLMFQVARQTQRSAGATYRAAALTESGAWVETIPWDSIDFWDSDCTSDSSGHLAFDRCVFVQSTSARLKEITLVITPTGNLVALPETLTVRRSRVRPSSPF